jgi:hypothetical protein
VATTLFTPPSGVAFQFDRFARSADEVGPDSFSFPKWDVGQHQRCSCLHSLACLAALRRPAPPTRPEGTNQQRYLAGEERTTAVRKNPTKIGRSDTNEIARSFPVTLMGTGIPADAVPGSIAGAGGCPAVYWQVVACWRGGDGGRELPEAAPMHRDRRKKAPLARG